MEFFDNCLVSCNARCRPMLNCRAWFNDMIWYDIMNKLFGWFPCQHLLHWERKQREFMSTWKNVLFDIPTSSVPTFPCTSTKNRRDPSANVSPDLSGIYHLGYSHSWQGMAGGRPRCGDCDHIPPRYLGESQTWLGSGVLQQKWHGNKKNGWTGISIIFIQ